MEAVPSFGYVLRRLRLAAGLTQEELAERAGVSWRTISDLERGVYRAPRRDTLALLVEALAIADADRIALEAAARRSSRLRNTVSVVEMPRPADAYPSPVARRRPDGVQDDQGADGPARRLPRSSYLDAQSENASVATRERRTGTSAASPLSFGSALRRYRITAGLSQEMLAERSNLSRDTIRALERGRRTAPRAATLTLLAAALGLTPAEHAVLATTADASLSCDPQESTPVHLPGISAAQEESDFRTLDPRRTAALSPPTPLLGREHAVAAIVDLLEQGGMRLLTLTGPGGVGKTRLALAVAAHLGDLYADGVAFVDLTALRDPGLVVSTMAKALGLREEGDQSTRSLVLTYVHARHMLMVLDNFEQVIDAAPFVADLIAATSHLTVVVTSRMPLGVRAEQQFPVVPLALPPRGQAITQHSAAYSAIQLFVSRVRAVNPEFALHDDVELREVAAICQRLDGLPLAIELAAVRCRLLSPADLCAALKRPLAVLIKGPRDLPARQQTLRAVINWSYELLTAEERQLFACLAVFAGGCTLDAAEAICVQAGGASVPDTMASLADHNLVVMSADGPGTNTRRTGLLETIREFAQECLDASGEAETRRRMHAEYYLGLAESAVPELSTPAREWWLLQLERERENLRLALEWALDEEEDRVTDDLPVAQRTGVRRATGLRLGAALWRFWQMQGRLSEGRRWLTRLLDADGTGRVSVMPAARAEVLTGAGWLAQWQGDFARATELLQECVALRRDLGLPGGETDLLINNAMWAYTNGDHDHAVTLLEECVARHRAAGSRASIDRRGLGLSLFRLGMVERARGNYERAAALYEECLALHRVLDDRLGSALALLGLGDIACDEGDAQRVQECCEESAAAFRTLGDVGAAGFSLNNLALAAYMRDDLDRALAYSRESVDTFRELCNQPSLAESLTTLGRIQCAAGDLEPASASLAEALSLSWVAGPRSIVAVCLEAMATLAVAQSMAKRAVELSAAATALRSEIRAPLPPFNAAAYRRTLDRARELLGDREFADAWTKGTIVPADQIVDTQLGMASSGRSEGRSPQPSARGG